MIGNNRTRWNDEHRTPLENVYMENRYSVLKSLQAMERGVPTLSAENDCSRASIAAVVCDGYHQPFFTFLSDVSAQGPTCAPGTISVLIQFHFQFTNFTPKQPARPSLSDPWPSHPQRSRRACQA
jgi:hypothetical protein